MLVQPAMDLNQVIVDRGGPVATPGLHHRQDVSIFYDLGVWHAEMSHQLCPARLKVPEIVRIIDNACGICVTEAHPHLRGVRHSPRLRLNHRYANQRRLRLRRRLRPPPEALGPPSFERLHGNSSMFQNRPQRDCSALRTSASPPRFSHGSVCSIRCASARAPSTTCRSADGCNQSTMDNTDRTYPSRQ